MKNMFNLEDKVAVVTGAASGLGKSAAIMYAEYGADVAVLGLNKEGLDATKREIEELGKRKL